MTPTRQAVIDVGTNSVKLLVAEIASGGVRPVLEQSEQTRLKGHKGWVNKVYCLGADAEKERKDHEAARDRISSAGRQRGPSRGKET